MIVINGVSLNNILLTGLGSTTAISVAKGLRNQTDCPVRIIGVDINEEKQIAGSIFCDKYYKVPPANDDEYLPSILKICEKENIQIVFPIIDAELEVISKNIDLFHFKKISVWVSEIETILTCNDKYKTWKFFSDNGFHTPLTWLPEEIIGKEDNLPYPIIIKPRKGVSSIDVFLAHDSDDLKIFLRKVNYPIVQQYIRGREYTIDVVMSDNHRILAVIPRERIEIKAGISYKGCTVKDEKLILEAGHIAKALKIKGACNIQCRIENGLASYFEINPRFSGTLPLTIAAGVNIPLILVKLTLKMKMDKDYFDFKPGVYMSRYLEEVFNG